MNRWNLKIQPRLYFLVEKGNHRITPPPAQGGPESSVRLPLTKNPNFSFSCPLSGRHLVRMVPAALVNYIVSINEEKSHKQRHLAADDRPLLFSWLRCHIFITMTSFVIMFLFPNTLSVAVLLSSFVSSSLPHITTSQNLISNTIEWSNKTGCVFFSLNKPVRFQARKNQFFKSPKSAGNLS